MFSMLLMLICSPCAAYEYRPKSADKDKRRMWHQISSTIQEDNSVPQIRSSGLVGVASPLELLALILVVLRTSAGWRAGWHRRRCSMSHPRGSFLQLLSEKLAAPWQRCSDARMQRPCVRLPGGFRSDKVRPTLLVETSGLEQQIESIASTSGVVVIDASNIRGRSGFRLGHEALLAATTVWATAHSLQGRVVLVVDHGAEQQAFYMKKHGLGVVFAGPNQEADRVISQDIWYWSLVKQRDMIIITADTHLSEQCRQKAGPREVYCVQPQEFISSLFQVANNVHSPRDDLPLTESLDGNDSNVVSLSEASDGRDERPAAELFADSPLTPEEAAALQEGMAALREAGFGDGRNLVRKYRHETGVRRQDLCEQFRIQFLRRFDVVGDCYLRPNHEGAVNEAAASSATLPCDDANSLQRLALAEEYVTWLNSAIHRCRRSCNSKRCQKRAQCRRWYSISPQPGRSVKLKSQRKHQPRRSRQTRRHR